ncbi:phage portal protein family protein [Formosa sp. A9]|uniref:phage portal protein family protein n=1 Tax=Formosa sp. A9 TaxID=3442641 RepID=UPI003EBD2D30
MKLPTFLYNPLAKYVFKNTDERTLRVLAVTKSGTSKLSTQTEQEAISMQAQSLEEWKMALLLASDPEEPTRAALDKLYKNLKLDNHLVSQFENRVEPVQGAPFKLVDANGTENEAAKKLFEAMWYIDFIEMAMYSMWDGTKVIELGDLDDNMLLKEVTEIPMGHLVPSKGLITKEAGGQVGWNYKEGVFKDAYIQIGKDNYLGMLAELAPIVLAKKLGVGSWLDYIEKYGVPSIFAITDREDQERMDQLYEALLNFKSNNFMVGRGQETFEIGKDTSVDAHNTFDKLIERANSEMSKRIVGATGTSDEKSHVGAAKVHADILGTKHKLDKFFIKVIINNDLIPRLVKLSPAYAVLANLTFDWDDTESLSLKELLEAIKDLSSYYEFDIKELENRTGLPIVGLKQQQPTPPEPQPEPEDPKGKKKSLN